MLGGVERIVERPAAVWTRLNGHVQSLRIVGDGRALGQYPGSTTASNAESERPWLRRPALVAACRSCGSERECAGGRHGTSASRRGGAAARRQAGGRGGVMVTWGPPLKLPDTPGGTGLPALLPWWAVDGHRAAAAKMAAACFKISTSSRS